MRKFSVYTPLMGTFVRRGGGMLVVAETCLSNRLDSRAPDRVRAPSFTAEALLYCTSSIGENDK